MSKNRKNNNVNGMTDVFQAAAQVYGGKKRGLKILPDSKIGKCLILIFIATDTLFLYQIINIYMSYSVVMTIVSAIIFATVLDTLPSIIAGMISKDSKKIKQFITGLCVLFLIIIFAVVFCMRYYSSDELYQTAQTSLKIVSNTMDDTATLTTASDVTSGQLVMTIGFGIIPIGTSLISLAIGIWDNINEPDHSTIKKLQLLFLKKSLIEMDGNITELEAQQARNLRWYDEENKKLILDDLEQYKRIVKEGLKLDMAMKEEDITVLNHKLLKGGKAS